GIGQFDESVPPAVDAVEINRKLVKSDSFFRPQLANSMLTLAACLSSIGQFEDAFRSSFEATDLYRQLVAEDRDRHLPNLAQALTSLAGDLGNQEQREEALEAAQEAVSLYREMVPKSNGLLAPFAAALVSLSTRLSFVRRHSESLPASCEAIAIL